MHARVTDGDVLLFTAEACREHDPGPHHPESPSRLDAILRRLAEQPVAGARMAAPPRATEEQLARVHEPGHVAHILALAGESARLDPDTAMSPRSTEAALLAAGAAAEGVRQVLSGEAASAFALVRPPGHHAEADRAMGFCLFNNAAVAAAEARARGVRKVLVLDWDVHHGNGTQHSFYATSDVLYMSTHQWPFYPGTGDFDETGRGEGEGFTVNVPLTRGCDDGDFAAVFEEVLLPIAGAYQPELVIVSAGFDAHAADPLGSMRVTTEGFAALCGRVKALAERHAQGRLVLTLEGGYDLDALAASVRACVDVLAGATPPAVKPAPRPPAAQAVKRAREVQRAFWKGAL